MTAQNDTMYEDPVERTQRLYSREIETAQRYVMIEKLENHQNPRIETFEDVMLLETKVKEITKDPEVKLVQSIDDFKMALAMKLATASVMRGIKQDMKARRMN